MDRIVSNATPLIYLAKADKLGLLQNTVDQVFIPEAAFREVVVEGKRLGEKDAYRVEKAVNQGWLTVHEVKKLLSIELLLHPGEIEVISLAKENGIKAVLMDDSKARSAAELAGLQPVGTIWIILQNVKNHSIDFDEFLSTVEEIMQTGFYLKEEVFLKAVRAARQLRED